MKKPKLKLSLIIGASTVLFATSAYAFVDQLVLKSNDGEEKIIETVDEEAEQTVFENYQDWESTIEAVREGLNEGESVFVYSKSKADHFIVEKPQYFNDHSEFMNDVGHYATMPDSLAGYDFSEGSYFYDLEHYNPSVLENRGIQHDGELYIEPLNTTDHYRFVGAIYENDGNVVHFNVMPSLGASVSTRSDETFEMIDINGQQVYFVTASDGRASAEWIKDSKLYFLGSYPGTNLEDDIRAMLEELLN